MDIFSRPSALAALSAIAFEETRRALGELAGEEDRVAAKSGADVVDSRDVVAL